MMPQPFQEHRTMMLVIAEAPTVFKLNPANRLYERSLSLYVLSIAFLNTPPTRNDNYGM